MTDRVFTDPFTGEVVTNPPMRPFADWLAEQGGGASAQELAEALWDVAQAVMETGKAGQITYTIMLKPMTKGSRSAAGAILTKDKIDKKIPEFDREPSVSYVGRDGNLTRQNPLQPELTGLRVVDTPRTVKEA